LIINADGFGFGPGATQGIIDAIREGSFISSVSVNANFPEVERVSDLIIAFPGVSIGVHLNAMAGRPCLPPEKVPSLIGPDGFFHAEKFPALLRKGKLSYSELEAEFDAQISTTKELTRGRLTHLDSQENMHVEFFDLFMRLARKWRVPCARNNASLICVESPHPQWSRWKLYCRKPQVGLVHLYRQYQMCKAREAGLRMADNLITIGYAGMGNKTLRENWLRVLHNLPVGTYEIYCHPGYVDDTLRRWSIYCEHRERELAVLRNPELCETARACGVEIISFDAI
jgi:predicted glycoside hydrolase/deacetylase ChbG (UPF0249 family)